MEQYILNNAWWLGPVIILWTLPWKGVALWKSARRNEQKWFIALLLINTLGLLEILYIFVFSKDKTSEVPENL